MPIYMCRIQCDWIIQGGITMIPMIGTIKSAVKLAELDAKWQQKKNNIGTKIFKPEEQKSPQQLQIEAFQEDLERMRENDEYVEIYNKIKNGKKLSPKEVEYLQKNNPQAYADYKLAQAEKEAFKRKLRNCETKEDVRKLKVTEMANYLAQAKTVSNNPSIPKGKKLEILGRIMSRVLGIEEVYKEFVKSTEYTNMEETRLEKAEEENREKPKKTKKDEEFSENENTQDTFIGEEFAEIEMMYTEVMQGTNMNSSRHTTDNTTQSTTENATNNATQEVKCDS